MKTLPQIPKKNIQINKSEGRMTFVKESRLSYRLHIKIKFVFYKVMQYETSTY